MVSNLDSRKASMIAIGGLALVAAAVITRKLFNAKQESMAEPKQLHTIPQEEQKSKISRSSQDK